MSSKPIRIEYRRVDSLRPDPKNARVHNEKQVHQIAESISNFGFIVPLVVDRGLRVILGHGRLLAAELLGSKSVPVIRVDHLSEHQRMALMIADNQLTEKSKWDNGLLGEQLKILSEAEIDFNIEVTGFEMREIDLFIENLNPSTEGEEDPADALPESSPVRVSGIGDLWQLGKHRVLCGDPLSRASFKSLMGDCRAHMVFTHPSSNVPIDRRISGNGKARDREFAIASREMSQADFTRFLTDVLILAARHSQPGSLHYVCSDWRHMKELLSAGESVYSALNNVCVWIKDDSGTGSPYRSQHELVFVFQNGAGSYRNKSRLGRFGRFRSNVWNYPGANCCARATKEDDLLTLDPTAKPVAMVADAIMDSSARGDVVLDPFLGGGTTIIAAERTGRFCYGIQLDPEYADTIVRRWQKFTEQPAINGLSGRKFAELEEEVENAPKQK